MTSIANELRALRRVLAFRGVFMIAAASIAVIWPENLLIGAMMVVMVVSILTALYEFTVVLGLRHRTPRWWFVAMHATLILSFGGLTVLAPGMLIRAQFATVAALDAWLMIVAWFGIAIVVYGSHHVVARWALGAWSLANVLLAVLAAFSPLFTIFSLLYFGALYAAVLGAFELSAGIWLPRFVGPPRPLVRHVHGVTSNARVSL